MSLLLRTVDKRKTKNFEADSRVTGAVLFTANGAGSTTTIVGANAAPGTDDTNVVRRGEKFRLFTSAGAVKEETVFRVTTIAVAGSTTVTFTPAAAAATASGDVARLVSLDDYLDEESMNRRLAAIDGTSFTADRISKMTRNDKIFALRSRETIGGI